MPFATFAKNFASFAVNFFYRKGRKVFRKGRKGRMVNENTCQYFKKIVGANTDYELK